MATKRIEGVVRDSVTGVGQGSVTVTTKLVNGGTTVTSTTTDNAADVGYYSRNHDTVGYPGAVYDEYTYSTTTKRRDGRVHGQLGGLVWVDDVPDVFALLGIGVVTGLAVSASGVSMSPAVALGSALLKDGMPYGLEANSSVTLDASDPTNPRIDRIVLRLTREGQTDQGKIVLTKITGTPAGSPAAPALTQTAATWDLSLAQVSVLAGVTTIAADKVTDERTYCFVYPTGIAAGDILYVNASGVLTRLAKGTSGQFLKIGATIPAWASVAAADVSGLVIGTNVQAWDTDLDGLAALAATGMMVRTGAGTYALRTLTGGANISISNGSGTAGNPTFDLGANPTVTGNLAVNGDTALGNSDNDLATFTGRRKAAGTSPTQTNTPVGTYPGAGTTPSASSIEGPDSVGRVALTTGTGPATGSILKVVFSQARPDANFAVKITPSTAAAGNAFIYVTGRATSGFEIAASTALTASTAYAWFWEVVEYEP